MPHFTQNNILVVTFDELVPKFYSSNDSLKNVLSRCEKRGFGLRRIQRGHNGGKSLIEFDSLPSIIKDEFIDPRKAQHILERFFNVDADAVHFYQDYRFWDGSSIDDEKQSLYVANASVINAVLKLREARIAEIISKRGKVKRIWETLCTDYQSFQIVLSKKYDLICDLPDNYRRFQEKCERYREVGYEYLISGKHLNTNRQKVSDDTIKIFESLFSRQSYKPTYTEVADAYEAFLNGYIELINNETGELYDPKQFPKLSTATVYNYLSDWKSAIGTNALRSGDRQVLMQRFKPYHSLNRPEFSGAIISIDDRQPPFEYGKSQRPWFYLGIDLASECFTTWVYGKTKESMIVDFYRQMVRNYSEWGLSLPAELECESSLNATYRNTLLQEGNMFQYVRIEANNARGKRIERYFRDLRYGDEKKAKGWLARPFAKMESNQIGNEKIESYPTFEALINERLREIQDWNNQPHSQYPEMTRWEYFIERQHPQLKPINWRGILPFIGYKTNTSCKLGQIRLSGSEFLIGGNGSILTGESLINIMKFIEGEDIEVYWMNDNDGNVLKAIAYQGSKFVCELIEKPRYAKARIEQTDQDIKNRELMSSYVMTVEGYANSRKKSIDPITVIDNRKKTLNNSFKIRELGETMIVVNKQRDMYSPEIIEECDMVFNEVSTPLKRDLSDRW